MHGKTHKTLDCEQIIARENCKWLKEDGKNSENVLQLKVFSVWKKKITFSDEKRISNQATVVSL